MMTPVLLDFTFWIVVGLAALILFALLLKYGFRGTEVGPETRERLHNATKNTQQEVR